MRGNKERSDKVATKPKDLTDRLEVIEYHMKEILEALDEELKDDLQGTPARVARMYMDELFTKGKDPLETALSKTFPEETVAREMIVVRDIPFNSWCSHHMIPFFGWAHVGYVPNGKILGLSKVARLVQAASKGLHIQEKVTDDIANALSKVLRPTGVIVVMEAIHTCLEVRGARAIGSSTITSSLRGLFRDSNAARAEFYANIARRVL